MIHRQKELYHKILRIIDYNTLNTVQGPTVKYGSVRQIVGGEYSSNEFEKAIHMLKKNGEIFEIERDAKTEYTLRNDEHLLAILNKEADLASPNKDLIGHINQMRQKT